jgi:hypothetical protein
MFPQIDELLEVLDPHDLGVRCEVVEYRGDWGYRQSACVGDLSEQAQAPAVAQSDAETSHPRPRAPAQHVACPI